ncbi:cytochrome d ubiquinol oxidase subunit II [Henriciella mobilis]|uniref:cytochrome d ubiquinol oxidase subunit II n=1 Tax=Henriciella mobilis TaxID=2305467 RepID=UPI000E66F83C|nr:cytochrome d ubiquinol oxidase subunit II [Henriciella mobilis]RIJ14053.1 cytochrome d ubiquinol oxidase subunit II [Henriciella mobilis]RIJ20695.1 cytochrome d ubiquinol oxidase subunit II [Henriciella mobilis]
MDYALIWSLLIATAVMMYVLLDGMDLGVGMLTFFATDDQERNMMTATIEPVWDGNETWLVLGGGGLFAAFPLAYSILMPAFYLPLLFMLAALIFRGVAFEFRHKAVRKPTRLFWNGAFCGGSFVAALSQGIVLGAFIQGVTTEGRAFAGGMFDWLSPFSLLVGASVVVGYVLLGSCWLVLKTEGELYAKSRRWGLTALAGVSVAFALVSMATLSVDLRITERWGFSMTGLDWGTLLPLAPVPLIGLLLTAWLARDLWMVAGEEGSAPNWRPYLLAAGIFLSGYVGLAISLFPWLVPFEYTIWEAAARDNALALMLVGAATMLPIILIYTAYVYRLFWGKVKPGDGYHGP